MKRHTTAVLLGVVLFATPFVGAHGGSFNADVDGVRIELTSRPERAMAKGETEYIARLTASGDDGSLRRSLGLGLACAAGAASFFALVGATITLIGGVVSPYLIAAKPAIALAVVALGVVQVLDVRMPSLALRLGAGDDHGVPVALAVFLYGFGYALASTGCTLPLYVSITVLPLPSGFSGAALLTFLAFAAAMAGLMLLTTLLVGLAKQQLIAGFQQWTGWIKRPSGVVLILAGLYLGYYYLAAGM